MKKYKTYTDQEVIDAAAKVSSMGQLLDALNLRKAGGNYANMKRILQRLNLKCEHWLGQGWNKDQQLKDWSDYTKVKSLKKHILKEFKNCEICNISDWLGEKICLEVHHKDGDRTNNSRENLQLLCPNCHSMTDNFRNRKVPVAQ